jgi:hypothetical protein
MLSLTLLVALSHVVGVLSAPQNVNARCRNQPGDPGYPSVAQWSAFNDSIDGRLINVVPSAKYCAEVGCTPANWTSGIYRKTIPGSMNPYNWEQDYGPPAELCLLNATTCAQAHVPLYAINVTDVKQIQTGIKFAQDNDLRIVMKSSGHDYLGRSTAKNSLLFWTSYFNTNVTFTDHFVIDGKDLGSALTVGPGVPSNILVTQAKAAGKIFVGSTAATVSMAGGYIGGAGHSVWSPIYGLAADNVFQFTIVLANGELVKANSVSHPDLFWALRGGGAGSWGVIVDVTIRTFPTFNATSHTVNVLTSTLDQTNNLMTTHAKHVQDWNQTAAGQFYRLTGTKTNSTLNLITYFAHLDGNASIAQMAPFLADAAALGATVQAPTILTGFANDVDIVNDDLASGINTIICSRFIPATVYSDTPELLGPAYAELISSGISLVYAAMVAGGKVATNAGIDSAVLPAWRSTKSEVLALKSWPDTLSADAVQALRQNFSATARPVLSNLAGGPLSGSHTSEGDVLETDFKVTFYGTNYPRLEKIKSKYDPKDLFIVAVGVHSDLWDTDGICRV